MQLGPAHFHAESLFWPQPGTNNSESEVDVKICVEIIEPNGGCEKILQSAIFPVEPVEKLKTELVALVAMRFFLVAPAR